PTFSNSKRMDDTLDIQRDHIDLVHQAMRVLAPEGLLIFSNNRKRFQLDPILAEIFAVEDVSRWSLDPDFERSPDIHQCWFIRNQPYRIAAPLRFADFWHRPGTAFTSGTLAPSTIEGFSGPCCPGRKSRSNKLPACKRRKLSSARCHH